VRLHGRTIASRGRCLDGVPLSVHTAHELTREVAAVAMGQPWRPILVLAIDGAGVPARSEMAKGFGFYLLADNRIVQVLSWHQVQTDEEAAAALRQLKAAGLIPEEEVRLGVIADGARWIWKVNGSRPLRDALQPSPYLREERGNGLSDCAARQGRRLHPS
jgi:hypothetical protein